MIGLAAIAAAAVALTGPAQAIDGDSLKLGRFNVRLVGVDAPEYGQLCNDGTKVWDCAAEAKAFLAAEILARTVSCTPHAFDAHRRLLAECDAGRGDIGARLVERGLALASSRRFYPVEVATARRARRGVWAQPAPVTPRAWRSAKKAGPSLTR